MVVLGGEDDEVCVPGLGRGMNISVKEERRRPAPGEEGGDCSDIIESPLEEAGDPNQGSGW